MRPHFNMPAFLAGGSKGGMMFDAFRFDNSGSDPRVVFLQDGKEIAWIRAATLGVGESFQLEGSCLRGIVTFEATHD